VANFIQLWPSSEDPWDVLHASCMHHALCSALHILYIMHCTVPSLPCADVIHVIYGLCPQSMFWTLSLCLLSYVADIENWWKCCLSVVLCSSICYCVRTGGHILYLTFSLPLVYTVPELEMFTDRSSKSFRLTLCENRWECTSRLKSSLVL
jgi:hypothetical protein